MCVFVPFFFFFFFFSSPSILLNRLAYTLNILANIGLSMIAKSTFVKASIHWWEWWWVSSRGFSFGDISQVRGQRRENFGGFTQVNIHTVKTISFLSFPFQFIIISPNFRIALSQRFRASVLFYLRSLSGIVAASYGTISISAKLHDKATDIRITNGSKQRGESLLPGTRQRQSFIIARITSEEDQEKGFFFSKYTSTINFAEIAREPSRAHARCTVLSLTDDR